MFAIKFLDNSIQFTSQLPQDQENIVDSFEFDFSKIDFLPRVENHQYKLIPDFENKVVTEVDLSIKPPTEIEQLRADVDYISVMTGVDLL